MREPFFRMFIIYTCSLKENGCTYLKSSLFSVNFTTSWNAFSYVGVVTSIGTSLTSMLAGAVMDVDFEVAIFHQT